MKKRVWSISKLLMFFLFSLALSFSNCGNPYELSFGDPDPINLPGWDPNAVVEYDYTGDWLAVNSLECSAADDTFQVDEATIALNITRKFSDTTDISVIIGSYSFVRGAIATEGNIRQHKEKFSSPKLILSNQQTICSDSFSVAISRLYPTPDLLGSGEYDWYNGSLRYSLGTDCRGEWYLCENDTLIFRKQ